jgi:hypothetical protein
MDLFAVLKFARAVTSGLGNDLGETRLVQTPRLFHNLRNFFLKVLSLRRRTNNGDFDVSAQ